MTKSNALHKVQRADIQAGHAAAELHDHGAIRALGVVNKLADQPPLIALSIATAVWGVARADRRLARTGARMLASHLLATAIKAVVKRNVDRARPRLFGSERDHRLTRGERDEGPRNSFPSGHTAGATAVSRAIAREYPENAGSAYTVSAAVGAAQIPTGAHFPIDVAVGAAIGIVAEAAVARVFPPAGEPIDADTRAQAAVTALTPP
ncbi:phosphatase PAP2 family protein [Sphingomonas sp. ac-8]|uniref:phosphatase PAP2 family protein n=1 Tax=Sphingomonas sp. ac-8 TaxID=3242977 RepID=UPI003A807A61